MEIDIVGLTLVAGIVASVGQWFIVEVLEGLGVKFNKALNQVASIGLAVGAGVIYIALYGGISLGSEADWTGILLGVYGASQLAYQIIIPKLKETAATTTSLISGILR